MEDSEEMKSFKFHTKETTLKSWTSQILFFLSIITIVATFFKFVYDIKESMQKSMQGIQASVDSSFKEMSKDMKADYATKEEVRFLKDAVIEMKGDLKETKGRIDGGLSIQPKR